MYQAGKSNKLSQIEELNKSKEEAIQAIEEFIKEIFIILKNLEKEAIKEGEETYSEMELLIHESDERDADMEMQNVQDSMSDSQTLKERTNQHGNTEITEQNYNSTHGNMNETATETKIVFHENNNIRETLCQFKSLGSVLTTKSRTTAYSVLSTRDFNIRLPNDPGSCNVSDACLIGPSTLLLVDNANKKLKRTQINQMSAFDECGLPAHPYCVCTVSKKEIAVTLSNNMAQFVSLGNIMTPTRQLNFKHCCYGIAYKDEKIYITDSICSLYIYDMKGNLLKTVFQDSFGNNLFEYSRQITVGDSGDKLLVSDRTNRLIVLDLEGKHIDTFIDLNMDQINGVTTDGRGNMFICGYASRNVIQIGQNLKKKMIIAKPSDGLVNPYSLCFAPSQCVLFVSQGNSDRMKVFQLK